MPLKDEVEEIISQSLRGSPSMLRYHTEGGEPPVSDQESIEALMSVILGLRRVAMLLADRIDALDQRTRGE